VAAANPVPCRGDVAAGLYGVPIAVVTVAMYALGMSRVVDDPRKGRLALTLITGFLGAGKTTIVNRVLTAAPGLRWGVIVNEFGEVGVDGPLLAGHRDAGVIEVANGCLCCANRGNMVSALGELSRWRGELDGILVEASGLADPLSVADIVNQVELPVEIYLSRVATAVDAENFDRNLDHAVVAFQQLTAADVFVVTKVDLVSESERRLIHERLGKLNPAATRVESINGKFPIDVLTDRTSVSSLAANGGSPLSPEAHEHDSLESIGWSELPPLVECRLHEWLNWLPADVVRVKGVVELERPGRWFVVHRVGSRLSVTPFGAERPPAYGRLTVIGRKLDGPLLGTMLEACAARPDRRNRPRSGLI
jgi:G3E family GTPase